MLTLFENFATLALKFQNTPGVLKKSRDLAFATFDNFDNSLISQNTQGSTKFLELKEIGVLKFSLDLKTGLTVSTMLTILTM